MAVGLPEGLSYPGHSLLIVTIVVDDELSPKNRVAILAKKFFIIFCILYTLKNLLP